jgi:hypothetical protein
MRQEEATVRDALDQLRDQLQREGATKLSWALERQAAVGHGRWVCTVQVANEMGAPVALPPDVVAALQQAIHDGQLGALEAGVWTMDLQTGRVSRPQPRPGDGAGAPGIAERLP